jgi:hypothetical protein
MKFKDFRKRINQLEAADRVGYTTFRFSDGTTSSVRIRHKKLLNVFIDTLDKLCAYPSEGQARLEEPTTPNDSLIELLGRAEVVETDNKFLLTIHGLCSDLRDQKERRGESENGKRQTK